jgi:hypothetical protein
VRVDDIMVKPPTDQVVVATFDEKDLQLILFEALMGLKRQPNISRDAALDDIGERNPELAEGLSRAATAAMRYVIDRLNAAGPDDDFVTIPTEGPMQ